MIAAISLIYFAVKNNPAQEAITFFPIDPTVQFQTAGTSLSQATEKQNGTYELRWQTDSTLDRKAYLRQDVGLLYSNGRLISKMGAWKGDTSRILQKKEIVGNASALLQALTFHYAEIHHNENEIFSAQKMTRAEEYVVRTPFIPLFTFRQAASKEEIKWKQILDDQTARDLQTSWRKGMKAFSIPLNHYHAFPLTQLYAVPALPGYSKEESDRIIGNLWEGLYKNYFLGIKKADGTRISPYGSTIPLILLAKDKTQLLVLTETDNGEPILLRQKIEYGH